MVRIANCPECEREMAVAGELPPDEEVLVRCPHCDESFAQSRLQVREVPELILPAATGTPDSADVARERAEGPPVVGESVATEASREEEAAATDAESPIDMPVITSTVRQEYEGEISAEPRAARTNGAPSFLRQVVGIIGGGVVGLAIGYFILLWIGGPEKDFLELGRHLPRWAVPGAFHAVEDPPVAGDPEEPSLADLLEDPPEDDVVDRAADPEGLPPQPAPDDQISLPDPVMERVIVLDPPEMTTADLEAALERAREALRAGQSGTSDRGLGAVYPALAALAEALTFAGPATGREDEHERLISQAEALLRDVLLQKEETVEAIGPLAAEWLDSPARDHGGIVAAGLVIGSHFGIQQQPGIIVELAGTRRNVVIVGPSSIQVPVGSRVVAAGSLVDRPKERIDGYVGSAPQVVWASLVEPVGPASPQ